MHRDEPDTFRSIDAALFIGAFSCAGAAACSAPFVAGAAALAVLVLGVFAGRAFARRASANGPSASGSSGISWPLALLGALAFAFAALRAQGALVSFERVRSSVERDARWPALCTLTGVVARAPVSAGDSLRVVVDVRRGLCDPGVFHGLVTLHVPASAETSLVLARGDEVEVVARLAPLHRFWNDGTGDPAPPAARHGVVLSGAALDVTVRRSGTGLAARIDRLRSAVRARIRATFPPSTEAMARALVLGEGDLPDADQDAFRKSGLSHLLAVSGMHLVLAVASLVAGLRALLVRVTALAVRVDVARIASFVGVPMAWLYADFAGGSGSAVRAAWMMSATFAARVLNRPGDAWRAVGLSVVGMQLADPLAIHDVSFVLSALATLGLLGLARPLVAATSSWCPRWASFVVGPLSATLSASIACAPVLAGMSAELPLVGALANVVAVPLGEVAALPLCFVHALAHPWPTAERGAALAASGALALVRDVARVSSSVSFASLPVPSPTPWQLAALFVAVSAACFLPAWRKSIALLGVVALVALEGARFHYGNPTGILRITILDVGQGDAALVDLPDGRSMLVDAGGFVGSPVDVGRRVIAPLLRARRRAALDVVVLSHPHPDHFGGMKTGLDAVRVGEFWDTGQGENEGAGGDYALVLGAMRARGVRILRPRDLCGARDVGGVRIEVLAPCPDPTSDRGPNDNSFVLRLRYGARSVLFVGDAEHAEEADLLAVRRDHLHADVLKIGHHGSRTSSSDAFLAAVAPRAAVISCGVRNRFGHPHPNTLRALARAGIPTFRTDRDGSVIVTTDGLALDVQSLSTTPM